MLKEQYRTAGLARTGVVLTIHNIAFQVWNLDRCGTWTGGALCKNPLLSTLKLPSPLQGWLTPNFLGLAGLDHDRLYRPDRLLDDTRPGFLVGSDIGCGVVEGGGARRQWRYRVARPQQVRRAAPRPLGRWPASPPLWSPAARPPRAFRTPPLLSAPAPSLRISSRPAAYASLTPTPH